MVVLGLGGAGLLLASLVSYSFYADHVDAAAADGSAEATRDEFDAVILRARLVGLGLLTLAGALGAAGRRLDPSSSEVLAAWWRGVRGSPEALRRWVEVETPAALAAFGLVIGVGVGLRLAYLGVPLRYDEATTWVNYVSRPIHVGLSNYSAPNNHVLHTVLAKLSVTILGDGPTALRLPALVAAIAIVPATFALGRVLYGTGAGLVAGALVATSSTLVEYSANARGYSLLVLSTIVAALAAVRTIERDTVPAWALVTTALALGAFAVPTMLYPAVGILVWIALSQLQRGLPPSQVLRRLATCAGAALGTTVLLYAPVLVVTGPRSLLANDFVESQTWGAFVDALPGHVADTAATWVRDVPVAVAIVLGALLLVSIVLTPRLSRVPIPLLPTMLLAAAIVLIGQRTVPFTRTWLFALPVAAVTVGGLVAAALGRARRQDAAAATVAVALAGAALVLSADSPRTSRETGALLDAPAVAAYLASATTSADRILATGSDTILDYYLRRAGVDASGSIYTTSPRVRTFVVVNTLGEQTLSDALADLGEPRERYRRPSLLKQWKSARVFLLERR